MPSVSLGPALSVIRRFRCVLRMRNANSTKLRRRVVHLAQHDPSGPRATMLLTGWRKSDHRAAFRCLFVAFGVIRYIITRSSARDKHTAGTPLADFARLMKRPKSSIS
jgi:hypothetical protein